MSRPPLLSRLARHAFILGIATAAALVASGARAADRCDDLLGAASPSSAGQAVTAETLLRLRDVGMVGETLAGHAPFSPSPDGNAMAVMVRRADPVSNRSCEGLVVVGLAPGAKPQLLDQGGDMIPFILPNLRGAVFPAGIADVNTPAWSPDGASIAYRKRIDGLTRVWLVRADGTDAHEVVRLADDVDAVGWTADGHSLIVSTWPALRESNRQIDEEGKSGFLYDRRIMPVAGARPLPQEPIPHSFTVVDPVSGAIRPATLDEATRLSPERASSFPAGATSVAVSKTGARAWVRPRDPKLYLSPSELWIETADGKAAPCPFAICREKVLGAWWSADGHTLRFLRKDGRADAGFAFWNWQPGSVAPVKTFATDDVYGNCESAGDRLMCDRDAALDPRQVVLLDPETGKRQTLFDPNPDWHRMALGPVRRLYWRNAYGTECFGDLILPPDHHPGQRHPLVVVQYQTRGFLRGAVGDEFPIQAFAAHGIAVLSVQRPQYWTEARARPGDSRDWETFQQSNQRGWIDRRNVLAATLAGVDLVAGMGLIDTHRVGITGLSEGAMSTWFAVANSHRFLAASLGSCCMDPGTTLLVGGEAWADSLVRSGYPRYGSKDLAYWGPMSLAQSAGHVTTPILMQVPDDEFMLSLESYESLKAQGKPVEMRIYPGEHHWKWQPAHRLAVYQRNLDWFDFWLQDREDRSPAKRDQYRSWEAMKASLPVERHTRPSTGSASVKRPIAAIHASTSHKASSRA
jgi:dipeptidyl aminopeptidase/acylaminoacyl peptidase